MTGPRLTQDAPDLASGGVDTYAEARHVAVSDHGIAGFDRQCVNGAKNMTK